MFIVLKGRLRPLTEQRAGSIIAIGARLCIHCRAVMNLSTAGIVKRHNFGLITCCSLQMLGYCRCLRPKRLRSFSFFFISRHQPPYDTDFSIQG